MNYVHLRFELNDLINEIVFNLHWCECSHSTNLTIYVNYVCGVIAAVVRLGWSASSRRAFWVKCVLQMQQYLNFECKTNLHICTWPLETVK